jgi:hypothetical protein
MVVVEIRIRMVAQKVVHTVVVDRAVRMVVQVEHTAVDRAAWEAVQVEHTAVDRAVVAPAGNMVSVLVARFPGCAVGLAVVVDNLVVLPQLVELLVV